MTAVRMTMIAASAILVGCGDDDEPGKKAAVQEARAACNVGRSAMVIMPNKLENSETTSVVKVPFPPSDPSFACLQRFRSRLGYEIQPIVYGDFSEAPE